MAQGKEDTEEEVLVKEPSMYNVVMHNDDFTTQEFVVALLKDVFNHNDNKAQALMMAVHIKGKAIAGTFQYEVAELKVQISNERAMNQGHPFKVTMEEA
jgi:ATP-dependent Clp protease adaptor protein ClpS